MCPILLQFFPDLNFGADLDSEPGSLQEFQDWNLFWKKGARGGGFGLVGHVRSGQRIPTYHSLVWDKGS